MYRFGKETHVFPVVAVATLAASFVAFGQMEMKPSGHQSTDKEKIADALRAGPAFITRNAIIRTGRQIQRTRIPSTGSCAPLRATGHACPEFRDTPMMNQCAWIRLPCNGSKTALRIGLHTSTR